MRRPQSIWARRDWAKKLRFVNGNKLQPERCGGFWRVWSESGWWLRMKCKQLEIIMAHGLDDTKVSSVTGDAAVGRLFTGGTVLCDGAMGTMLYARGIFI